ncbi:MAG: tRNA pseudouridine(55) synthase TruB [Acidobacteriota bacterium]|nr:tRNA pseudouridine(55) synthase TruB [Blastocatellia bacterium]MDW8412330.1 tRNA pseudouridine(55) synthase TruB [Acidobacteriota bacterium]
MEITGGLLLDKASGVTSHDLVDSVRRLLKTKKVGHTGTLDPFATGLMLLCIGRATKLTGYLSASSKEYVARARLGVATDTQDVTGRAISLPVSTEGIGKGELLQAIRSFVGRQKQLPPMYSAKKVGGKPLYKLARRGLDVERHSVEIEVEELQLLEYECFAVDGLQQATFSFKVVCSAGTYVRTLVHDIGQRLGCGAHLLELRRTRIGSFSIKEALTLQQVADAVLRREQPVIAAVELLRGWPVVVLTDDELRAVINGRSIDCKLEFGLGELVALVDNDRCLIAVAEVTGSPRGRILRPRSLIGK